MSQRKGAGEKDSLVRAKGVKNEGRPGLIGHVFMFLLQNLKISPKSQGRAQIHSTNNAQGKIRC
jgi:hypothetical protein